MTASIVIGGLAGYMAHWVPPKALLYFVLTLCVLPGIAYSRLARWLQLPSQGAAYATTMCGAAAFAYAFDVVHLATIADFQVIPLTPPAMSAFVRELAAHGESVDAITGERRPLTNADMGSLKALLIMLPVGMLMLNPVSAAVTTMLNPPFCGRCRSWLQRPLFVVTGVSGEPGYRLKHQLGKRNFSSLLRLTPTADSEERHVRVEVFQCETCGGPHYLTALETWIDRSTPSPTTMRHGLVRNVKVAPELVDQLQASAASISTGDAAAASRA